MKAQEINSAEVFADTAKKLTEAAETFENAMQIAQGELAYAQRRSKAQSSERVVLLGEEIDRFFSNERLRRYFVGEKISARKAAEHGTALTENERDDVTVALRIAGEELAKIRRACAAMPAAIEAAERELAAAEYTMSGIGLQTAAQAAPLADDLRKRVCKVFNLDLPAGATLADAIAAQRERAADEGAERLVEWVAYQQERDGAQP